MAAAIVGTNTEKIDILIQVVTELRTTVRLATAILAVCFPLMITFQVFLLTKAYESSAKLDRMADRLDRIERILERPK